MQGSRPWSMLACMTIPIDPFQAKSSGAHAESEPPAVGQVHDLRVPPSPTPTPFTVVWSDPESVVVMDLECEQLRVLTASEWRLRLVR